MLTTRNEVFRCNDPYRVRVFDQVLTDDNFTKLTHTFPDAMLTPMEGVGSKFSWNDRAANFLPPPLWAKFHGYVKNAFPGIVQETFPGINIDHTHVRFEFSRLPAHHGGILPHPDVKSKIATAVIFMERGWLPKWGGSFEILRHKERPDGDFSRREDRPSWLECETMNAIAVTPNRMILMERRNNSLHGVRNTSPVDRRSVTINLVRNEK